MSLLPLKTKPTAAGQTPATLANWQIALANVVTTARELLQELQLDSRSLNAVNLAKTNFSLRVPRSFVARMEKGNWHDPLLQQVLPQAVELAALPGYCHDPLQEQRFNPLPGLLHKYHNRVLLIIAGGCAIHCRYCFRRHFPYSNNMADEKQWQQIIDYIGQQPAINEVIYSGGDPLLAKDMQLKAISERIATIPHVKRLRIHTRLPIVIPERINDELLSWLTATRLKPIMVVHSNHGHEIDEQVKSAMQRLRSAGVVVLNQSVLLKGVNDSAGALIELSEKLFEAGIIPYYLNMLDLVQGAGHFSVTEQRAQLLMKEIMQQLPGYLVPKLVREQAGYAYKMPVAVG